MKNALTGKGAARGFTGVMFLAALVTLTLVAAIPPNATVVPAAKPVPVRVTTVPPAAGPNAGVIWVSVGCTTHCPCPLAGVGVDRLVVVPSPNSPSELAPQQTTARPVVSAHVWDQPATIDTTPLERPLAAAAVWRVVVVPSPSWP